MLNSHCNNNDKKKKKKKKKKNIKKIIKKVRGHRDSNTVVSTTLWRPIELIGKTNPYMLKL